MKATLRWLASLKLIAMEKVSAVSVGQMVGELTGRGVKSNNAVLRSEGACIVVDHEPRSPLGLTFFFFFFFFFFFLIFLFM